MTRAIETTVRIAARPATVWRYLVEGQGLARWWGPAEIDARPGGHLTIRMQALGAEAVVRGHILEIEPPHRLIFTMGWDPAPNAPAVAPDASRVEIVLEADGAGTLLRVRHSGLPDVIDADILQGWKDHLPRLAAAAQQPGGFQDGVAQ